MENRFLRIFYIYSNRHFWSIVISLFLFTLLSFNSITSASATNCITMQDGSVFTGTILPSIVKFKTKYGEIEINTENIVSFSMGTLILKDQSKLIGNFSSGSITIETSNKKLDFPATEVIGLTTKLASMRDEKLPSAIPNQSLSSSMKLNREDAKRILISQNFKISKVWYIDYPDGYFYTPGTKFVPVPKSGMPFSHDGISEQVRSYWSCLADKNLVTVIKKKKGKPSNIYYEMLEELSNDTEGKIVLTEAGQKYLTKDLNFEFKVIVNEITGIQYVDKTAIVAKVFFNGTVESKDNPFNQCFESCWDIQSLLNEPYALFELFDDGWRFKEWDTGGSFISLRKAKQPTVEKKVPSKETYEELTKFEELLADVKDAELFSTHSQVFPYKYDEVWEVINYNLKKEKEKITQLDKETGIIVTDTIDFLFDYNDRMFNVIEKYYIFIERINEVSTKVNLKLIAYYFYKKDKIVKPRDKYEANSTALGFLKRVERRLKKNN